MKKTSKLPDLLNKIKKCLAEGRYYDTTHAILRKRERQISLTHVLYVLKNGYHEKQKDTYKVEHNDWTYAIRGKTIDEKEIRIAVAFDEDDMLIITVIELERKYR